MIGLAFCKNLHEKCSYRSVKIFSLKNFPLLAIVSNNLKMSVFAFQAAHMMSHDAQSLILMLDQFVLLHGS